MSLLNFISLIKGKNEVSSEEWSFYLDGSGLGKRCWVDGTHKGNMQTTQEITVQSKLGSKLKGFNDVYFKMLNIYFVVLNISESNNDKTLRFRFSHLFL